MSCRKPLECIPQGESSKYSNQLSIPEDYCLRFDFEPRDSLTRIPLSMRVKNLTFQVHQERMRWAHHAHPHPRLLSTQPPEHACFNTVTTNRGMLPSLQASAALSQEAAPEMLKPLAKWAWPRIPTAAQRTSREPQGLPGGREIRRLPRKPQAVILLLALVFPDSHHSLDNADLFGGFS